MGEEDLPNQAGNAEVETTDGSIGNNQSDQEDFSLKEAAQRAARYVLPASLVAAAVISASKPNTSSHPVRSPEVASDVSPYEQGQKFLDDAAKRLSVEARLQGQSKNYVAVDTTIVIGVKHGDPPLKLYHTPFGFSRVKPEKADPKSMANPLDVKPGYSVVWKDPWSVAYPDLPKEPVVYAGNLAGTTTAHNRATDASLCFFMIDKQFIEREAQYYTPGGEYKPLSKAEVGPDGNLVIEGEHDSADVSTIQVMRNDKVIPYLNRQGFKRSANPQSAGH